MSNGPVFVCREHDAACAEIHVALRCQDCPLGGRLRVELDPAGNPKLALTALESLAVDACNRVKAWAESDRSTPFPEEAHALCDGVLMMAAQRRKGVQ